ncbi:periplasmic heavy metal sensor [Tardiphaga sp.]|uniref:periplasmic heavy metal sensor n=1 Tax=Tardiphaga sp. TaxID=1926292 RepID=UPI00352BD115
MSAFRQVTLVAIVTFLSAIAGVVVGRVYVAPASQGENEIHRLLHSRLDLGAGQQTKIEIIEQQFALRRRALQLELRADNARLAAAIQVERGYGPQVAAAVDRSHRVMGNLQQDTLEHIFAMRSVLRSDQTVKFDEAVASALTVNHR